MTPKATATKVKIDKLEYIKILKICMSKDTINGVKRQCIEWKKIFANLISDKAVVPKIFGTRDWFHGRFFHGQWGQESGRQEAELRW